MTLKMLLLLCLLMPSNALQQELYKRMAFPINSTAKQTIQKAETKIECASKCLSMSTNCNVFFYDSNRKDCIVTRLDQIPSALNSSENQGQLLGYVSIGKLKKLLYLA